MAWTAPMTWVAGAAITAAQLNAHLRDNMLETAPGKATGGAGTYFVGSAANTITERAMATGYDSSTDTTISTSYGDLTAGPSPTVTATTGSRVIWFVSASLQNNTVGATSAISVDISGSTTVSASDFFALRITSSVANANLTASAVNFVGMTAGSSTFTPKYKVTSGTGTYGSRRILVMPF